jgi:vancomycin resistance protein YoaR
VASRLHRLISRSLMGIALLILAGAATLFWFRTNYSDRVYPAISISGTEIGGMTQAEAKQVIDGKAAAYEASTVSFTYGDKRWSPTLAELGISVDTGDSLAAAYALGREDGAFDRVRSAWDLLQNDKEIPLAISVDETALHRWFEQVNSDLGVKPHDAYLFFDGGDVKIEPEVAGIVVDEAAMKTALLNAVSNLETPAGDLPVVAHTPRVLAADLDASKAAFESALAKPVKATFEGKTWTFQPKELGEFFVQTIDETKTGPEAVTLGLDIEELSKHLSHEVASDVNREPVNAKVGWNGEKVIAVEASVNGIKIKPQTFAKAVSASFFGDHDKVEIPTTVIRPEIDSANLDKLGITTRLAVGSSNFDGSDWGRAENIRVGASLLNGYLVKPHELFSFNHAVGVIDEEKGFVESKVVDGERIGRDIGGGICQVSTTVFRAAYKAGLPIEELHPHRYRMGFYELDGWPPGLDASILQPEGNPFGGGDFSFWNPSDSYMLVEAYTDGPRVVIILYGADLGYTIEEYGPSYGQTFPPTEDLEIVDGTKPAGYMEQTEAALEGIEVVFERIVKDKNGNVIEDKEFYSYFSPRGNVWVVSPDNAGQSPAAS